MCSIICQVFPFQVLIQSIDDMKLILQVYLPYENQPSTWDIRLSPEDVAIKTNSAQCLKQLLEAFPQKPIHTHLLENIYTGRLSPSTVFSKTFTGLCPRGLCTCRIDRFDGINNCFPTLTLLQGSALLNSVECTEVITPCVLIKAVP